jgi:hypothetical protein
MAFVDAQKAKWNKTMPHFQRRLMLGEIKARVYDAEHREVAA